MDDRKFNNLITFGTVKSISDDGQFAAVKIGDIVTKPLRLPAFFGQNFKASTPAHENAQVVLGSPSGNLEAAVILGFLWSDKNPPYSDNRKIDGILFEDGTTVEYNSEDKILKVKSADKITIEAAGDASFKSGGDMTIEAAGTISLKAASIKIEGPVTQTGGDMTSDGISAQKHKHTETGVKTKGPE